jgi:hypothetical protein
MDAASLRVFNSSGHLTTPFGVPQGVPPRETLSSWQTNPSLHPLRAIRPNSPPYTISPPLLRRPFALTVLPKPTLARTVSAQSELRLTAEELIPCLRLKGRLPAQTTADGHTGDTAHHAAIGTARAGIHARRSGSGSGRPPGFVTRSPSLASVQRFGHLNIATWAARSASPSRVLPAPCAIVPTASISSPAPWALPQV